MAKYKKTLFRQFFLQDSTEQKKKCEHSGCPLFAEHPAPRSKNDLRDYIWFCKDHIQEYNKNWNYFQGMEESDIEQHMRRSGMWDRPTWRFNRYPGAYRDFEKNHTFSEDFFRGFSHNSQQHSQYSYTDYQYPREVREALSLLEITPPLSKDKIKQQYKIFVKKFHPDRHNGKKEFEESLKNINRAYDLLKKSEHLWQ